ncbi:MAG: PDDEXK nuclease domain-containing protein [Methanomassiliicoccaceae archaeon]|nr:PDDEXK nuclease domain-containing protein [Methanomassiliicoccaceae archaeon]
MNKPAKETEIGSFEKANMDFIADIKLKVRQAQYEAMRSVNTQLVALYWELGKAIAEKQQEGWGKAVVPALSKELQKEFPGVRGFSVTNLWQMAQLYVEYHGVEKLQSLIGEISWTNHVIILNRCKDNLERQFYIMSAKKFGWTKAVLIHQIDSRSYERHLLNQTNFEHTLPENIRGQAALAVKDEYLFDFLDLGDDYSESQLETALVNNIRNFLLEMDLQFAFIGNQFRIDVDDKEYFIDLLLYHRQLQCLVAIELKVGEFIPEYKGKMEFYLSVLNDKVKLPNENDAVGIIICREKNRTVVEYSLKTGTMPIGVATYSTTSELPERYQRFLPDGETIAKKLDHFRTR